MSDRSVDQLRFVEMAQYIQSLPAIGILKPGHCRLSVDEDFGVLSSGQQILMTFFMSVWFGRNKDFDITRAAGVLDNSNKQIIADWLLDPFWP
jgi:hypothetical protein